MKLFKKIMLILVVFFKTGNLLSDNNLFNVNNIELKKKDNISSKQLANSAIKEAFNQLIQKILLNRDIDKFTNLSFSNIKNLVTYYNIAKNTENEKNKVTFSVTFDKDKIHNLFYTKGVSYSVIIDKEFYILPISLKDNEIFIFSNNYFYENWNLNNANDLVEFILPTENIEMIQKINKSRNNLLDLNVKKLFQEYPNKNISLAIIEKSNDEINKIYLKLIINNKTLSKNLDLKEKNLEIIISKIKDEITNLVKLQNLIDVRTPSFLNVKFNLDKKNNLVSLNTKLKRVDLIENIFFNELNKDYVDIKIKYLGKLDILINQLRTENINLELFNDQWFIETL